MGMKEEEENEPDKNKREGKERDKKDTDLQRQHECMWMRRGKRRSRDFLSEEEIWARDVRKELFSELD